MADPTQPTGRTAMADPRLAGGQGPPADRPADLPPGRPRQGERPRQVHLRPASRPGMLWARMLRCPHAHARVKSLDVAAAQSMPGVKAVRVIQGPGARDPVGARRGRRRGRHLGGDRRGRAAGDQGRVRGAAALRHRGEARRRPPQDRSAEKEEAEGDAAAALAAAEVRIKGSYGLPAVAHNCMEAHGQICHWTEPDHLTAWCSTQAVSGVASQLAEGLGIPAANVRVIADYVGGGFGSKFSVDRWGIECARLAKLAGAPVKLMLDRHAELTVAGDRPSAFAEIEVGAKKDGTLTAWISKSWGSGGPRQRRRTRRCRTSSRSPTAGTSTRPCPPTRRARAPGGRRTIRRGASSPMSALDDLAAALGMNPLDFVIQNLPLTGALEKTYREEIEVADQLMGWRQRWHPRGDPAKGPVKRGLGMSLHTWGGRGHRSNCEVTIHPDGTAEAKISTQDIGTGTRTVVGDRARRDARPAARRRPGAASATAAIRPPAARAAAPRWAASRRPPGGRRSTPSPGLRQGGAGARGAKPDELEAAEGKIRVKAEPSARAHLAAGGGPLRPHAGHRRRRQSRARRADRQRRRRRPDGRRHGRRRDRDRQDPEDGRRPGLRPDRRPEDGREPGLRQR